MEILWDVDWYDGPIAGLLEYNGEKCWFETVNDRERHGVVIRLRAEQLVEEEKWNALFEEKVWGGGQRRPEEMHAEFYEPYSKRVPTDFSGNEALGWIEL